MFKVTKERIIKNWPVDVVVPVDGGKTQDHPITLNLKLTNTVDANKVFMGQEPELKAAVVGWTEIYDGSGDPIPFSAEALENLLQNPHFTQAVVRAYQECIAAKPAEKNS
ncbi:hypothetical protein L1D34_07280 [Vibrio mediterranei]|uniref:hypothetical protein n=1 Tax=Vibrio mediterranei TaxID=689 RepID=UPI001EFDE556|nr:hypothetical protein [Vibrio mediterranei]MCG9624641.1 hypothetical protein [Vibrio mediterranei]